MEEQETIAERQTQQQQMVAVLQEAIANLDEPARQLLTLYYRDRATQQSIAQQLNLPQYTVSRKLTRTRETLLKAILSWRQTTLHIPPTSDVIASIVLFLKSGLEKINKKSFLSSDRSIIIPQPSPQENYDTRTHPDYPNRPTHSRTDERFGLATG